MSAGQTILFVAPPHGAADECVLLVRQENVYGLPALVDVDRHVDGLQRWSEGVYRADVDSEFTPTWLPQLDIPSFDGLSLDQKIASIAQLPPANFAWLPRELAVTCGALNSGVRPALRLFDGPLLDQIFARLDADSSTDDFKSGDHMPTIESLQREIDALKRQVGPDHTSNGLRNQFRNAQSRADQVARAYGDANGAPSPLNGESLLAYRQRLATPYKQHCEDYKDSDLGGVGDPIVLGAVEDRIYTDAMTALNTGAGVPPGRLRAIVTRDATGLNRFKNFAGKPGAAWAPFKRSWFVKSFGAQGSPNFKQCF